MESGTLQEKEKETNFTKSRKRPVTSCSRQQFKQSYACQYSLKAGNSNLTYLDLSNIYQLSFRWFVLCTCQRQWHFSDLEMWPRSVTDKGGQLV
ncbi:hypothetical protein FGO68_gene16901 [Halteria grandinella]|uniref:Uncharacterized protein n=1 Tax=Halteria grandinella TaxID=5974 RepID=A0A8J8NL50_HALGN|nr:hypothetical protein FGO68_gene16901 [Halteria grandinella]